MAYDKIIPIKNRLDFCVNYVLNPEKTALGQVLDYIGNGDKTITPDGKAVLQTAINCQLDTAYREMRDTKKRWGKPGGVLGYHLIHSYAPGEVTPEQAHTLGLEFVQELLQGKYETVVATHLDHDHIHCHILFNSVSLVDGKKYRDNFQAYFGDIRGASNAVSRRHGLSVIQPEGSGQSYNAWDAHKKGKATVRDLIRQDIDAFVAQSFTYASFLSLLKKHGYEIKMGENVKHTAIKPPGSSRFIRLDSLGENYTEDAIKRRLSDSRSGTVADKPTAPVILPKRYSVRRGAIPHKRQKLRGFRALYVHYLFFLGIWKPGPKRKYIPFSVRKDVTQLHRYQRQFRLMQEYCIESDADLSMLQSALQADMDALVQERKGLYKARRQGTDTTPEITAINDKLRQLRSKVKICDQIQADIPHIREQVQTIKAQERTPQKSNKQKMERRFTPWM